ncbi:hypothetical protein BKA93DRAFT_364370 [Sparassis latifolia]
MRTCRNVYAAALPRLLEEFRLIRDSWDVDRLLQYCNFMLADSPGRILHLRRLSIWDASALSQSGAATYSLSQVVRCATRLESISVQMPDSFFETYPVLAGALRVPPGVQYLELFSDGCKTYELLSKMASRPREINLSNLSGYNHGLLLRPFIDSLQVLRISGHSSFYTGSLIWPWVHTLEVGCCVDLSELSHAFPAVRYLDLTVSAEYSWREEDSIAWENMDRIHVGSFHATLFPCSARHLDLYEWESYPNIVSYVQRCSPIVLSCVVSDIAECLTQIAQAAPHVQYLILRGGFRRLRHRLFERAVVEHTLLLGALSLVGLSLIGTREIYISAPSHVLDSTYQGLARQVAGNVPSLEYIIIGGYHYHGTFHVKSRAGGILPEVEQLPEPVAHVVERQLLDIGRL